MSTDLVLAIIKAGINYVLPLILAAAITRIGSLADFVWKGVLRTWRGFVILLAFVLSAFLVPSYCLWVALVVGIFLSAQRLEIYSSGPPVHGPVILFTGFYKISENDGKLVRSGQAKLVDSKFYPAIKDLISDHKIQAYFPIRVYRFQPPKIIYSRDDFEGFGRRMRVYAENIWGVIWGIIDEAGRVTQLELTVNEHHFKSPRDMNRFLRDITRIFEVEGITTNVALDFISSAYAALVGHSFCDMLNSLDKWQASLQLAGQSRRVTEQAISRLPNEARFSEFVTFQKRRLLPMYLRQEALAFRFNKNEAAFRKLYEALSIDPLWHCYDQAEFAEFYNTKYAWELSKLAPEDHPLALERASYERRLGRIVPNLQLFNNWINVAATEGWVKDLDAQVEGWFASLTKEYPKNPFILLYWAEAIKDLVHLTVPLIGKSDDLRLEKANRIIEILEAAHRLTPTLPVISYRLHVPYLETARFFDSTEQKRRIERGLYHLRLGFPFAHEYLPSMSGGETESKPLAAPAKSNS